MSFLRPEKPAVPPPPPTPPVLPPPSVEQMEQKKLNEIRDLTYQQKKGYTDTILTSNEGDTETPEVYKKTLLGG